MKVQVNTICTELAEGATVLELVAQHTSRALLPDGRPSDGGNLGLAVARNGELVPRSRWAAVLLKEADQLDLVTAVQGG